MITVLTGENSYTSAQTLRGIVESFDGETERYDGAELDVRQLPDLFAGATLFAPERLIVIRGLSANKSLWTEVEPWVGQVGPDTHVVLLEPSPDKRTKTYKALQKHASLTDHKQLAEPDLKSWLEVIARRHEVELTRDAATHLIARVGHDQWRLAAELEKLVLAQKPITPKLIEDITEPYPESTAFQLLDAVFAGQTERAVELLDQISQREDPHQFLGLLSSQLMAAFAIVTAGSRRPDDIARELGLHPFVVKKLSGPAGRLGRGGVSRLVEALAHADERMKTTAVDPWRQLEIALFGSRR